MNKRVFCCLIVLMCWWASYTTAATLSAYDSNTIHAKSGNNVGIKPATNLRNENKSASSAAKWAAIAAVFSALAALIMVYYQRQNMLDSARPVLVLSDWKREVKKTENFEYETVTFTKIRNVGKGPALRMHINARSTLDNEMAATMSTERLSILPANEEHEIDCEIILYWNNVPEHSSGSKSLPIEIEIYTWCSKNYRHKIIYTLMVMELSSNIVVGGGGEIAPGVFFTTTKTIREAVWKLKLKTKLSQLPVIGKCIRKDS